MMQAQAISRRLLGFLALCFFVPSVVRGQATHMVNVGNEGSFYDPPTVAAALNDIVYFIFSGAAPHGVTQSSQTNPCFPLSGGFNSGLTSISNSTDPTSEAPVWSLTVTDVSSPIWFFCANTHPTSHCSDGMVGAINPASQDDFTNFMALAKNTTTTYTSNIPYAATGVGAVASQTLIVTSVSSQFLTGVQTSTSASSTSTTASSSATTTTPPSATAAGATTDSTGAKSHTGAIVGGVIGGAIVIGLIVIGIVILLLRRHRRLHTAPSQMYSYPNTPGSPRAAGMTERGGGIVKPDEGVFGGTALPFVYSAANAPNQHQQYDSSNNRTSSFTAFNPNNPQGYVARQASPPASDNASIVPETNQQNNNDINVLAKEVAAIIMQNRANGQSAGTNDGAVNADQNSNNYANKMILQPTMTGGSDSSRPPNYRALANQ